ncbi:hypothetical protein WISP_33962 [Willisornis vidua]|uniref:Uncharacterized protein n=1 Tax=Willisornis vidua TaxID=1566151 RepID=A0ABQ9DNJ5_9PASS|nr:hypothetical protein WISP_33962 [Willisornis vidua]
MTGRGTQSSGLGDKVGIGHGVGSMGWKAFAKVSIGHRVGSRCWKAFAKVSIGHGVGSMGWEAFAKVSIGHRVGSRGWEAFAKEKVVSTFPVVKTAQKEQRDWRVRGIVFPGQEDPLG